MKKRTPFLKRNLPLWAVLLAAVLLSGAITLLVLWCQPNSLRAVLSGFLRQPLLIVLNALPIGLLVLLFTCLFRNVFYGAGLVSLLTGLLSLANRVKLEVRDEPVFPRDLELLKELRSSLENYNIQFPVKAIAVVVVFSLVIAALGLVFGCRPFPVRSLRGWRGRIAGALAALATALVLIFTVYASDDLYNSFSVSNAYYPPSVFNELGFPYCFCHHFTAYTVDKPEGFNRAEAEGWAAETGSEEGARRVHVILVMNEAFSDLTDTDAFTFSDASDPLPHLHALQQDPHALYGHVVVPGFAGGTANTEFDVLTGMQTNALSATATSALRTVNRNQETLFRVFASEGYQTSFFHPGDDWFYNRENVFHWFGAETTKFVDEMESPQYKGRWVTDDYMAGQIEAEFERAVSEGTELFHYTTTIQNHMSYTTDKYGAGYAFAPVETSLPLSADAQTLLSVYTEGVRDADAMLGRLVSYFTASQEPVVLVYFGDHLPYLGDNQMGYRELGLTDGESWAALTSYETPYVIWTNDAGAEALDWDTAAAKLDLPEGGALSASFLGAAVLELTGRADASPWFRFLNQLRRSLPVVQKEACLLPDGTLVPTSSLTDSDLRSALQKWRQWSYYKLRYQVLD